MKVVLNQHPSRAGEDITSSHCVWLDKWANTDLGSVLLSMFMVAVTDGPYYRHPIHVWKGGSARWKLIKRMWLVSMFPNTRVLIIPCLYYSIFSSGNRPEWSHSFSLKISAHNSVKPDPPCQSEVNRVILAHMNYSH